MLFNRTFLYEADATDNGSGSVIQNEDNNTNTESNVNPIIPSDIQLQLEEAAALKAEVEELRAFRAANTKETELTPEEKERAEQLDRVNFRKFAVERDFAKDDDFIQFETLQQRKDHDLVFEEFFKNFKEENSEITDENELQETAKEEFNAEYKLNSANEKTKARGIAKLTKEAAEIRNPYSSKIEKAKSEYSFHKENSSTYENKFIPFTENVKKAIPNKLVFATMKDGDKEVPFDIEITPEDIKEVEDKFLKNHKTFYQFKEGKPEEVQQKLLAKIENYIISKKRDEGNQKIATYWQGVGTEKGSTTGADAPFHLQQSNNGRKKDIAGLTLEASNEKMAQARARFN